MSLSMSPPCSSYLHGLFPVCRETSMILLFSFLSLGQPRFKSTILRQIDESHPGVPQERNKYGDTAYDRIGQVGGGNIEVIAAVWKPGLERAGNRGHNRPSRCAAGRRRKGSCSSEVPSTPCVCAVNEAGETRM